MTHPNAQRVQSAAAQAGVTIEPVEYPEGTKTAADAAAAVGCDVAQIVKSMVFSVNGQLVLALTSGANRVDGAKLAALAGGPSSDRADPEAVRTATGYPIGGVPPFGHASELPTWIDPELAGWETVWAAAGTPRHVFEISYHDLQRLTGGSEAEFTA